MSYSYVVCDVVLLCSSLASSVTFIFSYNCYAPHRYIHSFPTRRSSDLSCEIFEEEEFLALEPAVHFNDVVLRCGSEAFFKRSEEHTSELQSNPDLVCRILLEKKKNVSVNRND